MSQMFSMSFLNKLYQCATKQYMKAVSYYNSTPTNKKHANITFSAPMNKLHIKNSWLLR